MNPNIVLKNRLREARLEAGVSQTKLAVDVLVSRNTIGSIESGKYCPSAKLALAICNVLDKKFEQIFYFD